MTWTLSIDFGTTNTAAAVSRDGRPATPVRLSSNSDLMPSAIVARPDGGILTSEHAVRSMVIHADAFVASPKRLLGLESVLLGGRDVATGDLVAAVLGAAAGKSSRREGGSKPDRIILTHPQEWGPARQGALLDAWHKTEFAGRADVVLVSEPVSAARALAADARLPPAATIAVLDYGGGTCDVAVLRRDAEGAPWTVLAHAGNDRGGADIDILLLDWAREQLRTLGHDGLDRALDDPRHLGASRTLMTSVREAKESLSEDEQTHVPVAAGEHAATLHLTRREFDTLIRGEVAEVRRLTDHVLQCASVTPADLDVLFLTGGSSHLRAVHRTIEDLLGGRPAGTLNDPKTVVAVGAHLAAESTPSPVAEPTQPEEPHVPRPYRPVAGGMAAAAHQLLRTQPSLAAYVEQPKHRQGEQGEGLVPELAKWLEYEANLVAMLAVPTLLEHATSSEFELRRLIHQPHEVPAVMSSGQLDEITQPARRFLGQRSAWYGASHTHELPLDVASRVGSATGLAVALVREWGSQDSVGRQQLFEQPQMLHLIAPWWNDHEVAYLRDGRITLHPVAPGHREAPGREIQTSKTSGWSPERHLVVAFVATVATWGLGAPYLLWAIWRKARPPQRPAASS